MDIVLIGAGNVSFVLGLALKKSGHHIQQVFSRSLSPAKLLAKKFGCDYTTDLSALLPDADLYIIAVRDQTLPSVVKEIRFIPRLIVHTSGTVPLSVFPKRFINAGVLYPLQTFTKKSKVNSSEIPFCLEATNETSYRKMNKLIRSLDANSYRLNSLQRKKIHLAAVFVNNFTNHLFTISSGILKREGLSFDLLKPLIKETVHKILKEDPAAVQTGPARRGDAQTIEAHLALLNKTPLTKEIYNLLSKSIEKQYGKSL